MHQAFAVCVRLVQVPLTIAYSLRKFLKPKALQKLTEIKVHLIGATLHFEGHRIGTTLSLLSQVMFPLNISLVLVGKADDLYGVPRSCCDVCLCELPLPLPQVVSATSLHESSTVQSHPNYDIQSISW